MGLRFRHLWHLEFLLVLLVLPLVRRDLVNLERLELTLGLLVDLVLL